MIPALLGVVLVAGCTEGGPEPASSTTAPVADVTPTPTATPVVKPERPAAMDEPTTDGAIAAATYFLQLYDYAFSAGDAGPLMAMSGETCTYCSYVDEQVQSMVTGGYSSVRTPAAVVQSDSTEIREDEWFRVSLRAEQGPLVTVGPDGTREQTSDGGVADFVFAISWIGDDWRVEGVDIVVPQS
ncbi:hypothetical protein ASD16_19055 [Cellulomonas sp. Root485]|uniref:DUF6318 family protein n=1 Tax=Cellulomonas sp. Root485 TaxID=1736546 RepID=UPI0006FAA9C2|nr:DUF6318 family protein [Cellulomonas sp. Root485]KQY21392.1 hypothetical protein ASD16_19055 [Cellulomonas sp. Root485]